MCFILWSVLLFFTLTGLWNWCDFCEWIRSSPGVRSTKTFVYKNWCNKSALFLLIGSTWKFNISCHFAAAKDPVASKDNCQNSLPMRTSSAGLYGAAVQPGCWSNEGRISGNSMEINQRSRRSRSNTTSPLCYYDNVSPFSSINRNRTNSYSCSYKHDSRTSNHIRKENVNHRVTDWGFQQITKLEKSPRLEKIWHFKSAKPLTTISSIDFVQKDFYALQLYIKLLLKV